MADGLLAGKRGVIMGVANEKSIAWACAKACAAHGAELYFSYQGEALEKRLSKLLEELPAPAPMATCDVGNDADIRRFFDDVKAHWGRIDFVLHSIAFAHREDLKNPFIETPRDHFALALDVSAYSLVAVAREAAPLMNAGGSFVAMTYYGAEKVIPNYNVMGVAKAALEASVRYLACDLGPKGIRCNAISAGPLRTLSASAISGMRTMLHVTEQAAPLRRNIDADEVGNTMAFLVSPLASGITGEVVHVDSGYNVLGLFGSAPGEG